MIEEPCVTCGVRISGGNRREFERRYNTHQIAVHNKPGKTKGGVRADA